MVDQDEELSVDCIHTFASGGTKRDGFILHAFVYREPSYKKVSIHAQMTFPEPGVGEITVYINDNEAYVLQIEEREGANTRHKKSPLRALAHWALGEYLQNKPVKRRKGSARTAHGQSYVCAANRRAIEELAERDGSIMFLVKGSSDEPYMVVFHREDNNLTGHCTCRAASNGGHCKHRINLLLGKPVNLVSDNHDDIEVLHSWLAGTDVEVALADYRRAEKSKSDDLKEIKLRLAAALAD